MRIERFPLGPLWTNGYLVVGDEGRAFFVDPGGDPEEVIERLRRDALSLEEMSEREDTEDDEEPDV